MRYTSFGWVDDDKNFNDLVAMNPVAYARVMAMQQSTQNAQNTQDGCHPHTFGSMIKP